MKIDLLIKCVKELGYHLGTILGTIWVPLNILGTTGVPNGTQSGTPMVPKFFSLKSMKSQLSKLVSKVVVRCLDPSLPLVEIV